MRRCDTPRPMKLTGILLLAAGAIVYGVLTIACGGSEQNKSGTEQPPADPGQQGTEAAPTAPEMVRFEVPEGGLEMGVEMSRHSRAVGERSVPTASIVSGDWYLQNFVFVGDEIRTKTGDGITDDVVLAMQHRRYDAELLVWTRFEVPVESEQYLDVVADEWVGRVVASESLLASLTTTPSSEASIDGLEALSFDTTTVGGRDALSVDFLRVHPTTKARHQTRMLILRQETEQYPVLLFLALSARRDDFRELAGELMVLGDEIQLSGEQAPLGLNPQRHLGPAGDEYGIEWHGELDLTGLDTHLLSLPEWVGTVIRSGMIVGIQGIGKDAKNEETEAGERPSGL